MFNKVYMRYIGGDLESITSGTLYELLYCV